MIIGIDLGTTNSACAIWRDGAAVLVPNRLGQVLTPSAVSVDESGAVLVGLAARERQVSHPLATATAFKRYMGTRHEVTLSGMAFSPEDLSALVLRSLKEDAEAFLGEAVTEAVITVPAYFNDRQRKATKRAGELAGLSVERLINEPTAAALAYGIERRGDESRFLIFDLGGGTFDVSVLELFEGVIEVRASTGDNRLGGEDFNAVLMAMMLDAMGPALAAAARTDPALHERVREAAERARRGLSGASEVVMRLVWREVEHSITVSAEGFEAACAGLLARLREPVVRGMRDSNLRPEALSEIILIGGATRMPVVRRAVAKMFGRFPNSSVNPDEAVALGAAVQAGLKARDAALREVVLTDVAPFSLGIEISERRPDGSEEAGLFSPIIERNTVIPASRVQGYQTTHPQQRHVDLKVYQGEARRVIDNVELGSMRIPVPPSRDGGLVPFECRFSYDINGLLEVDVDVPLSGYRGTLTIVDGEEAPDPAAFAERRAALAALKTHPRESEAVRAVLARAERCYESALGDARGWVNGLIGQFQGVVERQEPRAIEAAIADLNRALDEFEGDAFL
ncbi:Hsp70 family protein [Sandaracinobacteroides saxicola]|uniref:Molecular chaperone HscC n=1 Tax=Sandaracinobacteroides saxicola TaxID=2759707 RepID=A0A7G5IK56_9SPHN|nr:molecular chaperone HscC [Sandaracinobacteroides saxicola]QMW23748.1 molecular chaperone HscC [Sandaracinobacteroides saxicola]